MPAEEHVEPVGGLRGCGQGRAAAGRAEGGDGPCSCSGAREGIRAGRRQDGAGACRDDDGQARRTPTAAPKAAATAAPAQQPSSAQISAIRSACRSDYPKVCAGVPTGGAPALQCLQQNKAKLSAACGQAVSAATGGTAAPAASGAIAAAPAATATAAAPAVIVLRPMRPREELLVVRSACGADVRSLCGTVVGGGGRIVQCLASNAASLSPACKDVLTQFAAQ